MGAQPVSVPDDPAGSRRRRPAATIVGAAVFVAVFFVTRSIDNPTVTAWMLVAFFVLGPLALLALRRPDRPGRDPFDPDRDPEQDRTP